MASLRSSRIEADYDPIADVLYISLVDSDHPAYAENVNDMIFVMRSTDSDFLLGFEILDAKRHGAEEVRKALLPLIRAEKRRIYVLDKQSMQRRASTRHHSPREPQT